MWPVIEREATT
jgi:hypothetical protein